MDKNGALAEFPDIFQSRDQTVELMALDWTDIFEFERLEEHAGGKEKTLETFLAFFKDLQDILPHVGKRFEKVFDFPFGADHGPAGQFAT